MSRYNGLNDSLGLSRQIIRPCLCFRKILYFCTEKSHLTDKLCTKEQNGVYVEKEVYRHSAISIDMVFPHVMVLLCLSSTAHNDLQLRQQMLLSHLAVGFEFVNYYRREQDKEWAENRPAKLYTQFCNLVVEHYRENRNISYYAKLMDYDPCYFSKVFRLHNNGTSPLEWIQQYVVTQAKRIIDMNPKQTIKETAYQLGFSTTGNFCRYFKRTTGIYPQEYKRGEFRSGSTHPKTAS